MKNRLTPLALLGLSAAALAQQQSKEPPMKAEPMQKVEIKGAAEDYDPRRDDTASKTVINHEEIIKYGDTNVYDVLKRAPGVTVIGDSIRMRGLGNGYTQVLVNGERQPPGFQLSTLPPEQIERIEVMRAATAEHSMQAIAGTINVVLKKVVSKPQRDFRLNTSRSDQQRNLFAVATIADKVDNLSYYLNPYFGRNLRDADSIGADQFITPSGQVTQERDWSRRNRNAGSLAGLNPRLNLKLPNDDQLNFNGNLAFFRNNNGYHSVKTNQIGSFGSPDYTNADNASNSSGHFIGGELNWVGKIAGGKLDAKVSANSNHNHSESLSLSSTADQSNVLRRDADTVSRYTTYSSIGKYTQTLFDGHSLAAGWEINRQQNDDDVVRVEGVIGTTPVVIPEQFNPRITRYAVYGQDEWNVTKSWSVYLGARWETIRTDSEGTGLMNTQSNSHVLSPVAQTLYKFPDKSGRQFRMALTRTYKAPATNQLTARRFFSDENTRFNPDSSGNPDLKPELATGIDLTYEHFWAPGAVFSIGTSQRHITDYIRTKLTQDSRGLWLNQPLNDGSAMVRTLDFELKFPLKTLVPDALPFEFRTNFNKNWSTVDEVPGPHNRLDGQIPLSANIGVDYRTDKYSAGANFNYRGGGAVRVSEQQSTQLFRWRELEMYLLYKFRPGVQVRLAVNNALGEDTRGYSRYSDINGTSESWSRSYDSPRFQANLELKF